MNLKVGDVVVLKMPALGCETEAKGVVYATYQDFDIHSKQGVSVIFENGNYDGFSWSEQQSFFSNIHIFESERINYNFSNVMQLTKDFRKGYWNNIFK